MREKLATGAAVDADRRHSLSAPQDRCPVCGSTETHCLTMERRPCERHLARDRDLGARISVSAHLAQAIDDLAQRADVSPSSVLEWLIWAALRPCGVEVPRRRSWKWRLAWQRIEAAIEPSHPRHTETR